MRGTTSRLLFLILPLLLTACSTPSPEPTLALVVTPELTVTPTPTSGPTAAPTPMPKATPMAASSPAPTATGTPTVTAAQSPAPMATSAPAATPTAPSAPTAILFFLRAFEHGRWLKQEDPQLASSIEELVWIQDGIDATESEAIQSLLYIAVISRPVASTVVSLNWVQDGVDDVEAEAIHWMDNIRDAKVASAVVSLNWVQDGIDDIEAGAIEGLSYIAYEDTRVASAVVSLNWVQDGIDDVKAGALEQLAYIAVISRPVASAVVSLNWVQDGIDDVKAGALEQLAYIAYVDTGVASAVVSLNWVQDGVDDVEVKALEELVNIAYEDAEAALRIVGMPFVETIEPPDISAMASLRRLAAVDQETFVSVMSHAALRDGISNDLAPIVATLKGVADTNPALIDVLLDPNRVLLERRTITLPSSGDVVLVIIRTRPGAARSIDLLEHSVRSAEEYMGAPLPTNYVGLLYENAVSGSNKAEFFGTHIAVLAKHDVEDGSHEAEIVASSVIAHEVAHYYWNDNATWMDEGAADLMASIVEGARTGRPVRVTKLPCAYARTIAELESLAITQGDVEFGCNYSLGERLFLDLRRTLGNEKFRQGFRALYLASEMEDDAEAYEGTAIGIRHVSEAFRSGAGAENAVIARWYDGTEPYDLSHLDTGPVDASLPSINGRIEEAYIATSEDGPAVYAFSAQDVTDWVYLTLKYSFDVSGGPHEVPLEIVEYYEDGFDFRRRSDILPAEVQYIDRTWILLWAHHHRGSGRPDAMWCTCTQRSARWRRWSTKSPLEHHR